MGFEEAETDFKIPQFSPTKSTPINFHLEISIDRIKFVVAKEREEWENRCSRSQQTVFRRSPQERGASRRWKR